MISLRRHVLAVLLFGGALPPASAERTIPAGAYADKLRGMWLGQLIGVFAGLPTEGVFGGADPNPADSVPWDLRQVWTTDDDTDIEYLIQHVYAVYGFEPTPADLKAEWLEHVPISSVFIANRRARWLMSYGFEPYDTGRYDRNEHWWSIDPQLTTESIGAISPGARQWALDHVRAWGRITSEGTPVHAAQFYAALYAAAAFESDVATLIQRGLECLPLSSRARQAIHDVVAWHAADLADGIPDWRATRRTLYDQYQGPASPGRSWSWLDSTLNVASTTLALLYGDGDFEQTVQIAVLAGWDCDCNAATAGGLIGMIRGYDGLPAWMLPLCGDVYQNTRRPNLPHPGPLPQDDSIVALCQRWQALAEAVIPLVGGSITGQGDQRIYHLPDSDPVVPDPEQPDPDEAAGLVGLFRAAGESVTVSASIERRNPARDRDHLDGIADGVTDPRHSSHRPYWTSDANPNQPDGGDFYQLNFPRPAVVSRLVFYEGDLWPPGYNSDPYNTPRDGGFFITLTPEVRVAGAWIVPPGWTQDAALDPVRPFQVIAFEFPSIACDGVRVRGDAGGAQQFTTCMELEAYGVVAARRRW